MTAAFHPMTPGNPTDTCSLCLCRAEEKPNKPWVGHVVNNIKSWGDYFKSWFGSISSSSIHMFHKKCLKNYFEGKFRLCPGQCLQYINPSFFLSPSERIARSAKFFFKNAALGTFVVEFAMGTGREMFRVNMGTETGGLLISAALAMMTWGAVIKAVKGDMRLMGFCPSIAVPILLSHEINYNSIPESMALSIFSGVMSAGIIALLPPFANQD